MSMYEIWENLKRRFSQKKKKNSKQKKSLRVEEEKNEKRPNLKELFYFVGREGDIETSNQSENS